MAEEHDPHRRLPRHIRRSAAGAALHLDLGVAVHGLLLSTKDRSRAEPAILLSPEPPPLKSAD